MSNGERVDPADAWREKAEDLFRQRFLTLLARTVLDREKFADWRTSALAIQRAIYAIDAHYESSAVLSAAGERPLWRALETKIATSNGRFCFAVWKHLSELRSYATVEGRIHAFDPIDPREYDTIVTFKAADVGIARALVWSYGPSPSREVLRFWSCIDQCAELIEDLADIGEDGRDWNFNFWLYSYLAKGDVVESVLGASSTLARRLGILEEAYRCLPISYRRVFAGMFRQTLAAGRATFRGSSLLPGLVARSKMVLYSEHGDVALPSVAQATAARAPRPLGA